MANRVRISGGDIAGRNNEGYDAQVDKFGNLNVREGAYNFKNKTYETTSFASANSPAVHDFNADMGRNAVDGYIINDGDGDIKVDYSLDGVTFGDKFTMKAGDQVMLLHFNIDKIRVTWVADSAYRINLL